MLNYTLYNFQFEILFCIQDADDPAHVVVNMLMEKHPNISARVVSGVYHLNLLIVQHDILKCLLF